MLSVGRIAHLPSLAVGFVLGLPLADGDPDGLGVVLSAVTWALDNPDGPGVAAAEPGDDEQAARDRATAATATAARGRTRGILPGARTDRQPRVPLASAGFAGDQG
jgi:hypothetical protein